jgi:hypothetical protein
MTAAAGTAMTSERSIVASTLRRSMSTERSASSASIRLERNAHDQRLAGRHAASVPP